MRSPFKYSVKSPLVVKISNRLGTELFITLKDEEVSVLEKEILTNTILMVDDQGRDKSKRYERRVELRVGETPRDEMIVWQREPNEIFTELPATHRVTISLEAYQDLKKNGATGWRIDGPIKVMIYTDSYYTRQCFW